MLSAFCMAISDLSHQIFENSVKILRYMVVLKWDNFLKGCIF